MPLLLLVSVAVSGAHAQEWISLFDGKSFAGWDKRNDLWAVEDGALATMPGDNTVFTYAVLVR